MTPSPAIVAQDAVRRLPRLALWLVAIVYAVGGVIGRDPWKNADLAGFAQMSALAGTLAGSGPSDWWSPSVLGQAPESSALLPYWLGAWAIAWGPNTWLSADTLARAAFALALGLALAATWYATYHLARRASAQPVSFAFGGEAQPKDYARALADGALLALVACLGLAQLGHETTATSLQWVMSALVLFGVAALAGGHRRGWWGLGGGLPGLALAGAPALAMLWAVSGAMWLAWMASHMRHPPGAAASAGRDFAESAWAQGSADTAGPAQQAAALARSAGALVLAALATAALSTVLNLWQWRLGLPHEAWALARLLLWFTWPLWPLALWALWRWRAQWGDARAAFHIGWPATMAATATAAALLAPHSPDRALINAVPALAVLAAFALPTLRRGVTALIDWFALVFFSACAVVIWVIWIAMQTGWPAKPAANVAKLAPGFVAEWAWLPALLALAATVAWAWLVRWRSGRHRAALWKTMALPAGGAVLCWLLLTTLWLPLLNYARSYATMVHQVHAALPAGSCAYAYRLSRAQTAGLLVHGPVPLVLAPDDGRTIPIARLPQVSGPSGLGETLPGSPPRACQWLLTDQSEQTQLQRALNAQGELMWRPVRAFRRPVDRQDDVLLFEANAP